MKIFLLEDEFVLQVMVKEYLQSEGFSVTACGDGERAQELLYEERFDVLLLDVNVPKPDGFMLLKELRERGVNTPAIYITALIDIQSLKHGYDVGCDDYIKKPFEPQELLERVKSIAKRGYSHLGNMLQIADGLAFDTENEQLLRDSVKVKLHTKELKALKILLKNRNKIVGFEELFDAVWDDGDEPSHEALRSHVKSLRKAMSVDKIKNIRGEGYIFE